MSKKQVHAYIPKNLEEQLDDFREEHGIDTNSEAARQLLERGLKDWSGTSYSDQLARRAFEISGIGSFFSIVIGWSLSVPELLQAGGMFAAVCVFFGALWIAMNIDRVKAVIGDE